MGFQPGAECTLELRLGLAPRTGEVLELVTRVDAVTRSIALALGVVHHEEPEHAVVVEDDYMVDAAARELQDGGVDLRRLLGQVVNGRAVVDEQRRRSG